MLAAFINWTDQPTYQLDAISSECVRVYTLDQEGNKVYEECPEEMPRRFDSEYVDSEFKVKTSMNIFNRKIELALLEG